MLFLYRPHWTDIFRMIVLAWQDWRAKRKAKVTRG
jgi:hypothetical protein